MSAFVTMKFVTVLHHTYHLILIAQLSVILNMRVEVTVKRDFPQVNDTQANYCQVALRPLLSLRFLKLCSG